MRIALTGLMCLIAASLCAQDHPILIKASRMLDVRTGKIISPAQLWVRDGRIQSGEAPAGAEAFDFRYLVSYGMTPLQAIQSATLTAAQLLRLEDQAGTLQPGKWADIIAVDGNPLDDVKTLEQVRFVMKDGRIFKHP